MATTIWVKATKEDRPVPMEGRPRLLDGAGKDMNRIGLEPVEIVSSEYYRKAIRHGELVQVPPPASENPKTPATPAHKKE